VLQRKQNKLILWFDELGIEDVPLVGGKNASLGEMYRNLTKKGVRIPNGFAVTAHAYDYMIESAGIKKEIKNIMKGINTKDMHNLASRGKKVREAIKNAEFPEDLKEEIVKAYRQLCKQYRNPHTDVAVRSSATAEDLPDASFAGQQETYLNITGEYALLDSCKKCFASLFTNRAISYREDQGFDHFKVSLSIGVQKMVRSDQSSSGIMFSLDTESGFKDVVLINSCYGLGENIVQGAVNPDEFYVFKPTLHDGYNSIISRKVGRKAIKMIYGEGEKHPVKNVSVPQSDRELYAVSDKEVLTLAKWACIIEDHYSKKAGHHKPMDMEWAKDGPNGSLYIVQARPETVASRKDATVLETHVMKEKGEVIFDGRAVGDRIGSGRVHVIKDVKDIHKFKEGEVLITEMTDPDWEPIMKIAAAIVTNRGGRTCFTGDTKILTNKGFMNMEQVCKNFEGIKVPSLNKKTLKVEWKPVIASMKRQAGAIEISSSQTGRVRDNSLRLTPDHKMVTYSGGNVISKRIGNMLRDKDHVLIGDYLPPLSQSNENHQTMAYLLGAIATDGHIHTSRTHGEVQLIQKPTKEKQEFISYVNSCLKDNFRKEFSVSSKGMSSGFIRGKPVMGSANAYRGYGKLMATEMLLEKEQFTETLLVSDQALCYNFLAGVIDGDGSFHNNRIQIYISKEDLLQQVVVACLRLGIVPQVTRNRTIYNVQIVEKLDELLTFTKRVKGQVRKRIGTKFFSAKQLFEHRNVVGQEKLRKDKNLLVSSEDLPDSFSLIKESNTRMWRTHLSRDMGVQDVYNITVKDNHNYFVFTDRYTPIIVNNCHAAIISRELGIPCIVGTIDGTEKVKSGQKVTVSSAEGDVGRVYRGMLKHDIEKHNLKNFPKTKTKVMLNLGNPEQAFELSFLPNSGVGLAREEFIINSYIKIHPLALIQYDKLRDHHEKSKITEMTAGYKDKKEYFIDKLAQGVARIAAGFYPNDVIVRMSDFKSNEYANLIGGRMFEPTEDNPMIGWRGASRYYNDRYKEAFGLECKAMHRVRHDMGLKNLKVMVPFCRTVDEGKKVVAEMKKHGLVKGKDGLQIYVMCEIPANVVLAEEFAKVFDGFSIGSNDLTQLTLGLDRDSEIVASLFDERNQAVKDLISHVIKVAKKKHKKIGICGDSPSTYPDFAQFLVREGIDSISLSPDAVVRTTLAIAAEEKKSRKSGH
tara:strand:+ start:624 stop:4223 length:3600 start_codon:yes stop_codon:yes gene_type:complete